MTDYASQTEDAKVKKLFQDAADSAMKNKTGFDEIFINKEECFNGQKAMVNDALVGA